VNRLVPLFAILAVTVISRQWPRERSLARPRDTARAAFDGVVVAICIAMTAWVGGIRPCISVDADAAADTAAAESLRGTHGRLVTHFDWGEYALWHFGPALQVSIDGRRETLYSSATLNEQLAIARGDERGIKALERIKPDYVWLPSRATATAGWLTRNGYRMDVKTKRSYVAVRADLPPLAAWTGMPSGCFPGP
jgi:hypothetical protein